MLIVQLQSSAILQEEVVVAACGAICEADGFSPDPQPSLKASKTWSMVLMCQVLMTKLWIAKEDMLLMDAAEAMLCNTTQ